MISQIKVRRGTDAQRKNIILASGELAFCTDTKAVWVGDGVTYGGLMIDPTQTIIAPTVSEPPPIGSLLWWYDGGALLASLQEDQGTLLANQAEFAVNFLGICIGNPQPYKARICVFGRFLFQVSPPQLHYVCDYVGAVENALGTQLLNDKVTKVDGAQYAIGRVAEYADPFQEYVLVEFVSTKMRGGIFGTSPGGPY